MQRAIFNDLPFVTRERVTANGMAVVHYLKPSSDEVVAFLINTGRGDIFVANNVTGDCGFFRWDQWSLDDLDAIIGHC